MNANEKQKSLPHFDDTLDWVEWFENNDIGDYLDEMEDISPAQFEQELKDSRARWKAMPREEKSLVRVGENVRAMLLGLEMRQSELAARLGKDRAWVSRVVNGRENLSLKTLSQVAAALGCEDAALLSDAPPSSTRSSFPLRALKRSDNVLRFPIVPRDRFESIAASCGDNVFRQAA